MESTIQRMAKFSNVETVENIIKLGSELRDHYKYRENPTRFSLFSHLATVDYNERNKAFDAALDKYCREFASIPETFSRDMAFTFPQYERMHFSVMEEVINRTLTKSNIEGYMGRLAEVRNLSDGDSANVDIRAKNVYTLSRIGRGANASLQRHYGQQATLTPSVRQVALGFDVHQIASGRVDYGREIALASEGVQTSMLIDVIAIAFDDSNPINNKLIENTYVEKNFRVLCQTVRANNGGAQTLTMGTGIALSTILPTDTNLRLELGEEYMTSGYIRSQFGNSTFELPQAVDADYNLIVPNDKAVIVSTSVDTPIKIGMTNVKIIQKENTADHKRIYVLETEWVTNYKVA